MCNKYSFLLTKTNQILDGGGLTESHSEIASLHKVNEDKCNRYEWQPPKDWPDAQVMDGLVVDFETFTPKQSALDRIAAHITEKFPDQAAFDATTPIDEKWHEQKVKIRGIELTIICKPTKTTLSDGHFWVIGQTVKAGGNATVEAWDNATVKAWGNATVKAGGNATVEAGDNATVEAWDNATVKAWDNATVKAEGNATVKAWDNATVEAWGNATVKAGGNATVKAGGNATVEAGGNATVKAEGNATVKAWDNATVEAWGNATVKAGGNATVKAWDNATVEAWGNATVKAEGNATVIYPMDWWHDKVSTTLKDQAILIDRRGDQVIIQSACDLKVEKV